jgi:hypothetical protein
MLLNTKTDVKRSGMILLIVVAFLSMFLVVGTTYLLVADSIRRTSDFDLNATDKRSDYALMPDIDPRYMFNFALGQILYDVVDPVLVGGKVVTTNSALRGHSLARDIYGGYISGSVNDRPFQGTGKTNAELGLANYIVSIAPNGTVSPIYDPERGLRTGVNPNLNKISSWNPSYTYPDPNHLYLGSYKLDTAGNTTGKPSFTGLDAVGLGLDVKNLEGYPGGNDSYWIDAGFPVMTTPDGRKYKALIAPLILDLDGRINLNVAGNLMQRNGANPYSADHASNQGWGRWEINPKKLIDYNPYPGQPQNSPLVPANEFLNLLSFGTTSGDPATTFSPPNPPLNLWKTFGRFFKADYLPINSNPPPATNFSTTFPHSYAQVDFNAAGDCIPAGPMGTPPKNWGLSTTKPTFVNANGFPSFGNGNGFGNGQATEYLFDGVTPGFNYHARNFNPYRTQSSGNDVSTVFPVSETASILRWQGKGEPFSKSQVAQLLPKSLGLDMPYANAGSGANPDAIFRQRIRNMVTTLSADLDRPAMVPIDLDLNYKVVGNNLPNDYPLSSVDTVVLTPNSTTPPLKLDLNRVMRNFPKYNANNTHYNLNGPGDDPSKTAQQEITFAETDRRSLAQDIYNTLRNVTAFNGVDVKTNKWFAQLAVNIVDYIDNDDFSTAWQYDNVNWVFGVEMPRLVINEVYVQVKNNKMDDFKVNNQPTKSRATKDYDVNTYIELKNPLPTDAASTYDQKPGSHKAIVQFNDGANDNLVYRLVMNKRGIFWNEPAVLPAPATQPQPAPVRRIQPTFFEKINEPGNPYGFYDYLDVNGDPNKNTKLDVKILSKWNAGGDMAIDANSYFVVSSQLDFKANDKADPTIIPNFQSGDLNYTLAKDKSFTGDDFPIILLQKLPRPWLAENNNPADGNFNPFVTVDINHTTVRKKIKIDPMTMMPVVEVDPDTLYPVPDNTDPFNGAIMDRREFDDAKDYDTATEMNPNFVIDANKKSIQRQTPFLDAGVVSDYLNSPPYVPINKYFYNGKNSTLKTPTMSVANNNNNLPWFTFLDRQLINPMELIHVPCCKPHELTQMATRWGDSVVVGGVTTFPFAANWPWFDENTRLYRFLEAVGVSPLQAGEAMHGRVLGKVNVNTMHGEEVFQAVADAKPAGDTSGPNNFTGAEVTNGFNTLNGQRPILSFGQANYTDAVTSVKYGLNKSLMGYPVGGKPNENFLDVPAFGSDSTIGNIVATYPRKELLTKIGNSVTTRSNVFAVWITTGYFEVTDDTTQPPTLGLEIGKADGINIRHRMFAIVDRTNMVNSQLKDVAYSVPAAPVKDFDFGAPGAFVLKSVIPPYNNVPAVAGMLLTFEPNTDNEETISLRVNPMNGHLVGDFQKTHPRAGFTKLDIINRGNPGPWVGYDRTKDRDVVPYAEIIE